MAMNLVNPLSIQLQMHQQMLMQQQQMILHHYQQDDMVSNPNSWAMMNAINPGPRMEEDVELELENKKLWQQFHGETTEMIITKTGRRMFPAVQCSVSGLERRTRYCVLVELMPASSRRHKYVGGAESTNSTQTTGGIRLATNTNAGVTTAPRGWTSAGPAEPQPPVERRVYVHPDSPATGAHWMQHPLGFSKLKLTNNVLEHHSNVLLTSMHKYIPRIWIVRCDNITSLRDVTNNPSANFTFRETEFIAVTAYQNENITKLKIDHNPFAKGFRENGQSSCKRKRQRLSHDDRSSSNSEISLDEEEGNLSSSDSDQDGPLAKRSRQDCDSSSQQSDESCSVSSSDNNATPPPAPIKLEPEVAKPRLHRPWTDDAEEKPVQQQPAAAATEVRCSSSESWKEPAMSLSDADYMQQSAAHNNYLMALEYARIRQMQHQRYAIAAAAQHVPTLIDYRQYESRRC